MTHPPPDMMPWPRLLTTTQAAAYLGLTEKTVRNHAGQLPGRKKWGGKVVYDRLALDKLIDRNDGRSDLWLDATRLMG